MGIEEAYFPMSVHRFNVMLGGRLVGPRHCWRIGEAARGGRCRRSIWTCIVLHVFRVRLGLACLLACSGGICVSVVGWGVGWLGCETGTVLGDTVVLLPDRTWGASHTPEDNLA